MALQVFEFDCAVCDENTATLDPTLLVCDACAAMTEICSVCGDKYWPANMESNGVCMGCNARLCDAEDPPTRGPRTVGASWGWK